MKKKQPSPKEKKGKNRPGPSKKGPTCFYFGGEDIQKKEDASLPGGKKKQLTPKTRGG